MLAKVLMGAGAPIVIVTAVTEATTGFTIGAVMFVIGMIMMIAETVPRDPS